MILRSIQSIIAGVLRDPMGETLFRDHRVLRELAGEAIRSETHKNMIAYAMRLPRDAAFFFIREILKVNFSFCTSGDGDDFGGYFAEFVDKYEEYIFRKKCGNKCCTCPPSARDIALAYDYVEDH